MPNPNAIVSRVLGFLPPLDRDPRELLREEAGLSVELEDGRNLRLDPIDPRSVGFAQILLGLSKLQRPVYVEMDPQTKGITLLLIPYVTRISSIRPIGDEGLSIELEQSQARHVLRRSNADFGDLERMLSEAASSKKAVILVETDAHDVIEVREFVPEPGEPSRPFVKPGQLQKLPMWWRFGEWSRRFWPWWPCWCCVSARKAQSVFDAMNATTCDPLQVPPPCIPFLYPDDGCWGRAHQMCRLMIDMGLNPAKVWIKGNLYVNTKNNPYCHVQWGWHVAPTLCVRGPGIFQAQTMVIDPSLFTTPVSKATWKSVQGDPTAMLTDSAASDFLWGSTDPNYTQTDHVLATYRLKLQARSLQMGPPPYVNCP